MQASLLQAQKVHAPIHWTPRQRPASVTSGGSQVRPPPCAHGSVHTTYTCVTPAPAETCSSHCRHRLVVLLSTSAPSKLARRTGAPDSAANHTLPPPRCLALFAPPQDPASTHEVAPRAAAAPLLSWRCTPTAIHNCTVLHGTPGSNPVRDSALPQPQTRRPRASQPRTQHTRGRDLTPRQMRGASAG